MQTHSSQRNLKAKKKIKTEPTLKIESWQPMVLTIKNSKQICWLVDNVAYIYICNNKKLMIDFTENPIKIRRLTLNSISLNRRKGKIKLILKYKTEELVFTLINIFCLPNSSSNLVSRGFLINVGIYHYNKDQILYKLETRKTLAIAE